jgi:lipoyl(octanoyl) transferase
MIAFHGCDIGAKPHRSLQERRSENFVSGDTGSRIVAILRHMPPSVQPPADVVRPRGYRGRRGKCKRGGRRRRLASAAGSAYLRRTAAHPAMLDRLATLPDTLPRSDGAPTLWQVSDGLVPYDDAMAAMAAHVEAIAAGAEPERVWLLEHPPLYTAGTSARRADLLDAGRFPVHATGRGGQYTYHGPGQRVAYAMLDLTRRQRDVRRFVGALEEWIIRTLAAFGVTGERRADRVGVWVRRPDKGPAAEDKIAAIGVRVRRWVSSHGIAINCEPELDHFSGIVPCGISRHGVTSLADLGLIVSLPELDMALREAFEAVFGGTVGA